MPNGRTSLFYLTKEEFGRLLEDLPDDQSGKTVTALEIRRRLDEHIEDIVAVDEQDHAWYIVMFMKPPRINHWIVIDESSPLHGRLRQFHAQWLERRPAGEVVLIHGRLVQYDGKQWREKKP